MSVSVIMAQDSAHFMGSNSTGMLDGPSPTQQISLQPVFIPRHQLQFHGGSMPQQQPNTSPSSNGLAGQASADWAFLLRNAGMLHKGGSGGSDNSTAQLLAASLGNNKVPAGQPDTPAGRAGSPQQMMSPLLITSTAPSAGGGGSGPMMQVGGGRHISGSGLIANSSSLMHLDALNQLSADALAASAAGDPSNSFVMMSNGSLAPTLSAMFGDASGVQTLYGSDEGAAAASAAAAANATARASAAHSILQQQAAAAVSNTSLANSLSASLAGTLWLPGMGKMEESLSGSLFGGGGAAASSTASGVSPKPVSASLYLKNLPADADKLFLYEKFSPYGAILSVKVLTDPQTGQCRGVGFVNFAEHSSALRSIQALHGTKVGDKLLHVSLQTPRLRAALATM